jgi:tetratricopeptide (TPR) repeat protein
LADSAKDIAALLERAVADHKAGQLEAAERGYRALLEAAPGQFDALHLLGVLAQQTGRHGEAVALIDRALAVNDLFPVAHFNRSVALQKDGQTEAAIRSLQRAIELKPDYADAHLNLGVAMRRIGRLGEAEKAFRHAIAAQPDLAAAYNNLGAVLENLGRADEATEAWSAAILHRPNYAEAYRSLAQHDPSAMSPTNVKAMEDLLANGQPSADDLINLCFGLAEIYEARGDFDKAFVALSSANAVKRSGIKFSMKAETSMVESVIAAFADGAPQGGFESDLPVFVVGMPRSGTSLVEQILASHSQIFGAGELTLVGHLAQPFIARRDRLPVWSWSDETPEMAELGERYVAGVRQLTPDACRVVDKMPQNFLFLGFIAAMLPRARVIHVRRDPADTCLACYKRLFSRGENFAYDLAELGAYYSLYDRVMRHWQAVLPDLILEVAYEDLVASPREVVAEVLDHIGLDWEDGCMEFHRNRRPVMTASAAQVRRPLYGSSIGRWRRFDKHLGPLFDALGPLAPAS